MRAYLRIDPALADNKDAKGYSDGAVAAFLATLCAGEQQPDRGRFKTIQILRAYLGRRARWIPFLYDKGDIVNLPDGRIYIDGWDEWQEGDWTVKERVARIRNRAKVTAGVTVGVTVGTVNAPRLAAIADSGKRIADSSLAVSGELFGNGAKALTIDSKGWRGGEPETPAQILGRIRGRETHG